MSRSSLVRWLVFLAFGVGLGLYVGWVLAPVEYVDTAPNTLQQVYKDDYLLMLATAYAGDGDLAAARAGLSGLGLTEMQTALSATAGRLEAAGHPAQDLARLQSLSEALSAPGP